MAESSRRLQLDLPPGFVRLPTSAESAHHLRRIVERGKDAGYDIGDIDDGARRLAAWVAALSSHGVHLVGSFVVETENGPSSGTLTLAVQRVPVSSPETLAQIPQLLANATREVFTRRNPHAQTRILSLPIGPAMAALVFGEFRLPEAVVSDSQRIVATRRVHFLIPLPTGRHLVALDVSTVSETGWPTIARTAASVASSLRIEPVS